MFYTYNQNNSGGYFIQNEDVTQYVIVEANTNMEADKKLNRIVEDYSEFCPCCGERWETWGCAEGYDEPCIYGKPLNEIERNSYKDEAIIYYLNGSKELYKFK